MCSSFWTRHSSSCWQLPLAVLVLASCGSPAGPSSGDELRVRRESSHLSYRMAEGDAVDTAWMERYFTWVVGELAVVPRSRIEYRKYRNREHLRRLTGRITNGFAEPGTYRFHTIWPVDNHEIVHVIVIAELGHPPALFNEGVAVAHQALPADGVLEPRWNGRGIHVIAAEQLRLGTVPPLSALLESTDFFGHSDQLTYPLAGSFVRFLLDRDGLAPFRTMLSRSAFADPAAKTRSEFQNAYGTTLDEAWADWQAFVLALGTD